MRLLLELVIGGVILRRHEDPLVAENYCPGVADYVKAQDKGQDYGNPFRKTTLDSGISKVLPSAIP